MIDCVFGDLADLLNLRSVVHFFKTARRVSAVLRV